MSIQTDGSQPIKRSRFKSSLEQRLNSGIANAGARIDRDNGDDLRRKAVMFTGDFHHGALAPSRPHGYRERQYHPGTVIEATKPAHIRMGNPGVDQDRVAYT